MINFKYQENKDFFVKLFNTTESLIDQFGDYFDFREVDVKRKEFNLDRKGLLEEIVKERGLKCELGISKNCDLASGIQIDHFIPLSTNELNKKLRNATHEIGRKVTSASYGSNNKENLLLACKNCNYLKKHRFVKKDKDSYFLLMFN